MSQVLKTAPEVTSLSSTDRVQIVDANGMPKRIAPHFGNNKSLEAPKGTWIRIGKTTSHNISAFVLFGLTQNWGNLQPQSLLIAACMSSGDYNAAKNEGLIQVVSSTAQRNCFTKARLVVANTSRNNVIVYLDVFQAVENGISTISVIGSSNFEVNISANATIPDGYEAKEFSLVGGG